jgi:hypothetical protein
MAMEHCVTDKSYQRMAQEAHEGGSWDQQILLVMKTSYTPLHRFDYPAWRTQQMLIALG